MKVEAEELINYHCPRWNELPEIELYIDQVICVLQSNLSIFSKEEKTRSKKLRKRSKKNFQRETLPEPMEHTAERSDFRFMFFSVFQII